MTISGAFIFEKEVLFWKLGGGGGPVLRFDRLGLAIGGSRFSGGKNLRGYIIPVYNAALDTSLPVSICFPFHLMETIGPHLLTFQGDIRIKWRNIRMSTWSAVSVHCKGFCCLVMLNHKRASILWHCAVCVTDSQKLFGSDFMLEK